MNILYCGDKNISDGLIMSVLSLLDNTSEPLNVYILTAGIKTDKMSFEPLSQTLADFLDGQVKKRDPRSAVRLFDVTEYFEAEPPNANLDTRFTPLCMLRLFADKIDALPERLLYLDNDVLCRKDFSKFYCTDMTDAEYAGVPDHYGKWFFGHAPIKHDYVNSGVLLLNMELIKKTGLFEKCRQMCAVKKMFMPDQTALNKLAGKKLLFDRRYNEQRRLHKNTVFQHFTTSFRFLPYFHTVSVKPWDTERMHSVLGLYEYDTLTQKYISLKQEYERELQNDKRDSGVLYNR